MWFDLKTEEYPFQFFDFNGSKVDIKDVVWDMTDSFHKLNQTYQISSEKTKANILSEL
jgi:hypothetical protein